MIKGLTEISCSGNSEKRKTKKKERKTTSRESNLGIYQYEADKGYSSVSECEGDGRIRIWLEPVLER